MSRSRTPEQAVRDVISQASSDKSRPLSQEEAEALELLAPVADGERSLKDLSDADLERIRRAFDAGEIAAMLGYVPERRPSNGSNQEDLKMNGIAVKPHQTRHPLAFRVGPIVAMAAAVLILAVVGTLLLQPPSGMPPVGPIAGGNVGTDDPPVELAWSEPWGTGPLPVAQVPPDWSMPVGGISDLTTMGPGGDDRLHWRLATVIVQVPGGHGSGAFISADGWIITNYHVVSDAVQQAAERGWIAEVDVITAAEDNGRAVRRAGSTPATVYRVDPRHDLALLKLQRMPDGLAETSYFMLAESIVEGADCYVVGSPGGGAAWLIRGDVIDQIFEYPQDLTDAVMGVGSPEQGIQRTETTVVQTGLGISGGDSGGPLLNEDGEIIGVTFATPTNFMQGAVGYHVALDDVAAFVGELPGEPEGAPFDLWTAGSSAAATVRPQGLDADSDGHVDALVVGSVTPDQSRMIGIAVYISLEMKRIQRDESALMPYGLWGFGEGDGFGFDVVLFDREDGLRAAGYTIGEVLSELRIDRDGDGRAEVIWMRGPGDIWRASSGGAPLIAADRLGRKEVERIERLYDWVMRGAPTNLRVRGSEPPTADHPKGERGPADRRGPNKLTSP